MHRKLSLPIATATVRGDDRQITSFYPLITIFFRPFLMQISFAEDMDAIRTIRAEYIDGEAGHD